MLAVFGIGPIELIIVGAIVLGVVVAITTMSKRSGSKLRGCPHCGHAVSQGEASCPKCRRPVDSQF